MISVHSTEVLNTHLEPRGFIRLYSTLPSVPEYVERSRGKECAYCHMVSIRSGAVFERGA